jgi:hypothetical protein
MTQRNEFNLLEFLKTREYKEALKKRTGNHPKDGFIEKLFKGYKEGKVDLFLMVSHLNSLCVDQRVVQSLVEDAIHDSEEPLFKTNCHIYLAQHQLAEVEIRLKSHESAEDINLLLSKIRYNIQKADSLIEEKEYKEEHKQTESKNPALQDQLNIIRDRLDQIDRDLNPVNRP